MLRRAAWAVAQRAGGAGRWAQSNAASEAASCSQQRGAAASAGKKGKGSAAAAASKKGMNSAAAAGGHSGPRPVAQRVAPPQFESAALTPAELAARGRSNYILGGAMLAMAGYGYYVVRTNRGAGGGKPPTSEHLVNWSGTHECQVARFFQPESLEELEAVVKTAHKTGRKLRCVGSGLSPNGLAFNEEGMVSLTLMDNILSVDPERQQVTVQAGARVQAVADELRKHGLSLQNYASIREQTVGGFTQVSAHGTGAAIPPVDEQVVALKLVTPALGTIELSKTQDPELFNLARVGLGLLGVVAEVTLQCVPAHRLVERTKVSSLREVRRKHVQRLQENKHLRYMWIPHTDTVVVVTCNEVAQGQEPAAPAPKYSEAQRLEPLLRLLSTRSTLPADELAALSATQCRDHLLALDPLGTAWVKKVNAAEAEHWKRCEGTRVGWSDELLGFDCGGQQWVLETAFPAGTLAQPDGRDLAYMEDLLTLVSSRHVAAPAPIEQRWTAGSSAGMSPAAGPPGSLHSWVGIIMYLPEDAAQREDVTASFRQYASLVEREVMAKYGATEHWAKIEVPSDPAELAAVQARLAARYPVAAFNAARRRLDPHNILGSPMMDALLPRAVPAVPVAATAHAYVAPAVGGADVSWRQEEGKSAAPACVVAGAGTDISRQRRSPPGSGHIPCEEQEKLGHHVARRSPRPHIWPGAVHVLCGHLAQPVQDPVQRPGACGVQQAPQRGVGDGAAGAAAADGLLRVHLWPARHLHPLGHPCAAGGNHAGAHRQPPALRTGAGEESATGETLGNQTASGADERWWCAESCNQRRWGGFAVAVGSFFATAVSRFLGRPPLLCTLCAASPCRHTSPSMSSPISPLDSAASFWNGIHTSSFCGLLALAE